MSAASASAHPDGGIRRPGLDLIRGVAVLAMVLAHTTDAWTRLEDRHTAAYRMALFIGGFGAPAFLFLAGVTQSLAASRRQRRGARPAHAGLRALRHGVRIFALAFVFEIQSFLVSGGELSRKLARVDILHVMGLAMCSGALLWMAGRTSRGRAVVLVATGLAATLLAPLVVSWDGWATLPPALGAYIAPVAGRSIFTLLPWTAFFFLGAAVGVALDDDARLLRGRFATVCRIAGPLVAGVAYGLSWLPSVYGSSDFWTTSPAFFFIRLGVLITLLGLVLGIPQRPAVKAVCQLGMSSFFVYWIHVEMVYGVPSRALHHALTFWQGLAGCVGLCVLLTLLVKAKAALLPGDGKAPVRPVIWKPRVPITRWFTRNSAEMGTQTR